MEILSIHVDESGDFGSYNSKFAPYYIFSLVFHNQDSPLTEHIKYLDREMAELGFFNHVIHTAPLIRKEDAYCNRSANERRAVFTKLFYFAQKAPITYKVFAIDRKICDSGDALQKRINSVLTIFLEDHLEYFQAFDRIILYYDNGQRELSQILISALRAKLNNIYRKPDVHPYKYKLLQVADMICTLKLLEIKADANNLSKSETLVFHSVRDLRKEFIKKIKQKEME